MRIISKFKDYYDSVQAYGIDSRPVYVRNTEKIKCHDRDNEFKKHVTILDHIREEMPRYERCSCLIAFCGIAYPFYQRYETSCYDIEQLIKYYQKDGGLHHQFGKKEIAHLSSEPEQKKCRKLGSYWLGKRPTYYGALNRTTWRLYKQEATLTVPDSVFMYFKAPIILRTEYELILNPRLNQYNFMTQVDPYTAYQELSMYIGNNLATQMDPDVNISDKVRAESKGFNEWSFRRHKDESKKNK